MNPIPYPITVNTGEQHTLTEVVDNFFIDIVKHVQQNNLVDDKCWNICSGELNYGCGTTDDRITYLKYKDAIVASVFQTSTEFNHIRYTFFRNLEGIGICSDKRH